MIKINKNILQLKPSATLAINQEVKRLRQQGEEVFHFGFGQSPFKIHRLITTALKEHATNNHYLPSTGLPELKKEISKFLSTHQQLNFDSNSIFIGPGSKELLYQLIYLLDGVFLIPKGSWVSYVPQIKSKGAHYTIVNTKFVNNYKLTAEELESSCNKYPSIQKTVILNSPNNPTGAVYTHTELKELSTVCKKHNVNVLSDEIYSQVNFAEECSPSIAGYYPEKTIVFGGLSKVFSAGGYRLGFAAIPKTMHKIYKPLQSFFSETFSAVSAPVQFAAIEAYQMNADLKNYIVDCTQLLKVISQYVYQYLEGIEVRCTVPQGAFYMLVDFEIYRSKLLPLGIKNAESLCTYLLTNEKIALLPGQDFYFDNKSLTCRLAFVDFDGEKVYNAYKSGATLNADFVENYTPTIYNGLKKIDTFLKKLS